ncbi:MAG TPA: hypothetical protein DCZ92_06070 [Elusimicrobia bacterium]|nr:hypothetical protein [Elusimicrobiota bacterium]
MRGQVKTIVAVTFAAEALGALALWLRWRERADIEAPILAAVFHAVSAFCTAGFSLLADGLARFRADGASNAIVVALMLLGSLGFPVFQDLGRVARSLAARQRPPRLALHTRLALVTTGVLVAAGLVAALGLEWRGVLAPLTLPGHLLAAVFLAVTAQSTTGFNTVDTGALGPATLWLVMVLMFVGGSPGSTAGGVKTTTLATVVASVWATLRGRARVEAFRRTLSDEQVTKALALIGISLATVAVAILALLATQTGDALALTFEAVSAFGTVGLSTNLTPTLDAWGKAVVIAVMFIGRTGPLTLGFALAARARRRRIVYPPEKIMIG